MKQKYLWETEVITRQLPISRAINTTASVITQEHMQCRHGTPKKKSWHACYHETQNRKMQKNRYCRYGNAKLKVDNMYHFLETPIQ